jgi:hypothetical protein
MATGNVPSGWTAISNKTFSGAAVADQLDNLSGARNRAYVNCIFQNYVGTVAHGNCGNGVRFINCTFRKLRGEPFSLFFPGSNWATSRDNYGLKWINCTFEAGLSHLKPDLIPARRNRLRAGRSALGRKTERPR